MNHDDLPAAFVTHASEILGDTALGLSGPQIVRLTVAHAIECGANLPHSSYPFSKLVANKRTALYQNLMALPSKHRFRAIREMCEHQTVQQHNKQAADKLKILLFTRYAHLNEGGDSELNAPLIEQTRHWLDPYPEALVLFDAALQKYEHGVFHRNVLDDLRLALETLLKSALTNSRSLENQIAALGGFIKDRGGSAELANMFRTLVDYYSKYQNTYVKHDDAVIEEEVEVLFEITASFMRHVVRMHLRPQARGNLQ
jgi:hypothetical protein